MCSVLKKVKLQKNYILVTFELRMNVDVSIAINQIIMYRISNNISWYQLNSKEDHIIFICIKMTRHYKRVVKRKQGHHLQWSAFFVKLVLFKFSFSRKNNNQMTTCCTSQKHILHLQFVKDRMSISSKLRPQEEVEIDPSKRNTLYIVHTLIILLHGLCMSLTAITNNR